MTRLRRAKLKIKLKSLTAEARIIRFQEAKEKGLDRWDLQHHRKTVVRTAARQTQIAYALLRGRNPLPNMLDLLRNWHQARLDFYRVYNTVKHYGDADAEARLRDLAADGFGIDYEMFLRRKEAEAKAKEATRKMRRRRAGLIFASAKA